MSKSRSRVCVVVPVYNALTEVKLCLESLQKLPETSCDLRCVVVDDCSEEPTRVFLEDFCARYPRFQLIRNAENRGYTRSVNIAVRAALDDSDFVCLMNSDCEVPETIFDKLLPLFAASPWVGVVAPMSNAASYQSLPYLYGGKSFAVNAFLRSRYSLAELDALLGEICTRSHVENPVASIFNGVCALIRADVFRQVGLFDEELFPMGYGEETDFACRLEDAGWIVRICMSAFVWHHKSKSFGSLRRRELSRHGHHVLRKKYGVQRLLNLEGSLAASPQLRWLRDEFERRISEKIPRRQRFG